eukprot:Opistho-2@55708
MRIYRIRPRQFRQSCNPSLMGRSNSHLGRDTLKAVELRTGHYTDASSATERPYWRGLWLPCRTPCRAFFGIRRGTWLRATDLNPSGFKIALELLVKTQPRGVREIPYSFVDRLRGESKLKLKTQLQYALQVMRLYWRAFPLIFVVYALVALLSASFFAVGMLRLWCSSKQAGTAGGRPSHRSYV